jgi:MFS family permease
MSEARSHNRIPLIALLAANAVSLSGNTLALIAIPWFVLETTGSAAKTGVVAAAGAIPVVIAGIFGGVLTDRIGFRRMSVVSDIASALAVALIPLLHLMDQLTFPMLVVLVFLGALLDAPGRTARVSILPDLAAQARMRLERANAFEQAISRFSFLAAPPLAGILVAAIGTSNVLWLNAASFVISAAIVQLLVPRDVRVTGGERVSSGYLADMREGVRFVRADRLMSWILASVVVTNFLDSAIALSYPVYAARQFGAALDLGLMFAASATGALCSTLAFAAIGHRLPRRETYIFAFVLSGIPIFILAATPGLAIVLAGFVIRGLGAGPLNPIMTTVYQERVPAELRGRVFGLMGAIAWLMIPAGQVTSGVLIERIGLVETLLALGCAYMVTTLSMLLIPAFRELNGSPSQSDDESAMTSRPVATRTVAEGTQR